MPQHNNKKKKNHKKNQNHKKDKNNNEMQNEQSSVDDLVGQTATLNLDGDNSASSNGTAKAYDILNSPVMGRYLVAARDLKPGEIVTKVSPIVIGPCADSNPVCLGCYSPLPPRSRQAKCPGCGWGVCNLKCPGMKKPFGHSIWECSKLREKRIADFLDKSKSKELSYMYETIVPLRCLLLKENDPDRWRVLNTMEAHNEIRRKQTALWDRNQEVIVNRLRNTWGITEYTEDEIHSVCGFLEVNCFEIGHNGSRARALYPEAFLLAHDCTPNTTHTDDPLTHELIIRVTKPLAKGEAITLSYAYTLQGTLKRREHLQECKFFWCQCKRCTDPTELGTYSSAMRCPKCHDGLILTTDPLNQCAPFKCQSCNYTVLAQSMVLLLDKIFNELDTIDVNDIQRYEEFLVKYRNVLHKNHYLCISAKHSLCQLYGRSEGSLIQNLNLEDLKKKEDYCRDVLHVIDHLEPGLSRLRGVIMYELHAPIMIQATRLFEIQKISCDEFKKRLREVVSLLKDSERILSLEPKDSSEYTMALAAQDALQRIGKI